MITILAVIEAVAFLSAAYPADGPSEVSIVIADRVDVCTTEAQVVSTGAIAHGAGPEVTIDTRVTQNIREHIPRPVEV